MMETRLRKLLTQIACTPKEARRTREGVPERPGLAHPKLRAQREPRRQLCSEWPRQRQVCEIVKRQGGAVACTEGAGCQRAPEDRTFPREHQRWEEAES